MRLAALALALALGSAPAAAQQQDFSKVQITVENLAPGVAVLFGSGGNIGLSYGEDGNVIVDDQFAPLTGKVLAAIATLDKDPVRFVINTHWHFDHTGGNENLGKSGAVIVAQDNVRARMSTQQFMAAFNQSFPPSPKAALPVVTFGDGVTLHLNGDAIHVVHVANAHTDGDSLVHWQKADVLHTGDTFVTVSFPFIDLSSGGSIDGLIAAAEASLRLAGTSTKIIPGHGPVANRQQLVTWRDMLVGVRNQVAAGIKANRTLAQIQSLRPAGRYSYPAGFITAEKFVEAVYNSLRNPPRTQDSKHRH